LAPPDRNATFSNVVRFNSHTFILPLASMSLTLFQATLNMVSGSTIWASWLTTRPFFIFGAKVMIGSLVLTRVE